MKEILALQPQFIPACLPTLYLEETRTGNYPATKNLGDIAAALPSNARSDGGKHPAEMNVDDMAPEGHAFTRAATLKNAAFVFPEGAGPSGP